MSIQIVELSSTCLGCTNWGCEYCFPTDEPSFKTPPVVKKATKEPKAPIKVRQTAQNIFRALDSPVEPVDIQAAENQPEQVVAEVVLSAIDDFWTKERKDQVVKKIEEDNTSWKVVKPTTKKQPIQKPSEQKTWRVVRGDDNIVDIALHCNCCNRAFVFSIEQQIKYKERQWAQPKKCKSCTNKRYLNNN